MTMKRKMTLLALMLAAVALLAACAGTDASKLNNEGNDAYAKQAYEEAWARYQAAQIEDPAKAEPYYNAANALYRQGNYQEALEQMQQALAYTDDESLASRSFFNLGNTAYNLQDLATAVDAYKQALLRDPNDQDAKHNLELALAQQQQQQSQQQQSDQEQQQSDQQQQDQQDQQQQSQDQQGQGDQQQQDQQNPGQQDQQQNGQSGDQQQDQQGQGDQQQQDDQGQQGNQQQDQQGDQQPQDQQGEQQQDGQQQRPGQDGTPDSQPQAGQGQQAEGQPDGENGYSMMPEPGQRLSADQARQLLAAIGRSSQTLQEALGQIFGGGNRPPLQDW